MPKGPVRSHWRAAQPPAAADARAVEPGSLGEKPAARARRTGPVQATARCRASVARAAAARAAGAPPDGVSVPTTEPPAPVVVSVMPT